ncbi:MAG: DUF2207 domain-containing protein, partial [Coriobacteriia bacterium]
MKVRTRGMLLCAAALVTALAFATPAFAKEYSMGPVDITALVNADGSMDIVESRTYDFKDDFTRVFWDLNSAGSQGIEVVGVSGPDGEYLRTEDWGSLESRPAGQYFVEPTANGVRVSAYHQSNNESKTFALRYKVLGAAVKWDDTGELYWQFVGDQWDLGATDITVGITLPNPGVEIVPEENVRAWAHGPLTGTVHFAADAPDASTGGDVILEVPEIPALTFVEARILFPREWLSTAADTPGARFQEAMEEEAEWAEQANADRLRARILTGLARWGTVLLSLAAVFFGWREFEKHGREHKPQFQGEYFREEPADLHPAIVGALWRMGAVKDSDMSAAIMNLANEGVVSM